MKKTKLHKKSPGDDEADKATQNEICLAGSQEYKLASLAVANSLNQTSKV